MQFLHHLIGSDADTILWWQMAFRAILIFFYTLFLVRIGGKRVFGKNTGFDIVLGVILGSVLSRALTANAQFIPSLAATAALVLLHKVLAILSFHSPRIGHLVKGKETRLISEGQMLSKGMRQTSITHHDLKESMRLKGVGEDVRRVDAAFLERSGDISILQK